MISILGLIPFFFIGDILPGDTRGVIPDKLVTPVRKKEMTKQYDWLVEIIKHITGQYISTSGAENLASAIRKEIKERRPKQGLRYSGERRIALTDYDKALGISEE